MNKLKGFSALLATGLLYASYGIYIRFLERQLEVFQQIVLTAIIGFLLTVTIIKIKKIKIAFNKVPKKFLALYAFLFPLGNITFTTAVLNTSLATAVFALYIGSLIFTLGIGIVFFKEKVTTKKVLSLILVIAGLVAFTYPLSRETLNIGFLAGLACGLVDALMNTCSKYVGGKVDSYVLIAMRFLVAFIFILPLMFIFNGLPSEPLTLTTIVFLVIYGVSLLSAFYFAIVGFSNFDLNLGTIVISSELVFATLIGLLLYQEYPTTQAFIGGLLIVSAIVVSNYSWQKKVIEKQLDHN